MIAYSISLRIQLDQGKHKQKCSEGYKLPVRRHFSHNTGITWNTRDAPMSSPQIIASLAEPGFSLWTKLNPSYRWSWDRLLQLVTSQQRYFIWISFGDKVWFWLSAKTISPSHPPHHHHHHHHHIIITITTSWTASVFPFPSAKTAHCGSHLKKSYYDIKSLLR